MLCLCGCVVGDTLCQNWVYLTSGHQHHCSDSFTNSIWNVDISVGGWVDAHVRGKYKFLTFCLSSTTVHINTSGLLDKRNALASIEGEISAGHTVFVRLKFI